MIGGKGKVVLGPAAGPEVESEPDGGSELLMEFLQVETGKERVGKIKSGVNGMQATRLQS
jgi:hypothetical protein